MSDNQPTSRELIAKVLQPNVELTSELFRMVKSLDTGDPTHRFQRAGLTVFLAGVDKSLSLAFQLLYLAGKVNWKWMTGGRWTEPGYIECHRGLTSKLNKLHALGLDLKELQWIADLRNMYIHQCTTYVGYGVEPLWDEPLKLRLRAYGPKISFSGYPLVSLAPEDIESHAEALIDSLGVFLDQTDWQNAWSSLTEVLKDLPIDPEPELSQVVRGSHEDVVDVTARLNERYIGEGLNKLDEGWG